MAWRVPSVAIAGVAIVVLLLMYRSVRVDLSCENERSRDGWRGATSVSAPLLCPKQTSSSNKSVAQFLREKVQRGAFEPRRRSKELAPMDVSTQDLVSEVVAESLGQPTAAAMAAEEQILFGLNYGVMRVVRRVVICSAYRTSLSTFSMIALSPEFTIWTPNPDYKDLPVKDPSIYPECIWLEDGSAGAPLFPSAEAMNATGRVSTHTGAAVFRWMNEVHGTSYDTVMIHCTFPSGVGESPGGFLYLNVSHGPIGSGAPSELVPVLHERPNDLNPVVFEEPTPETQFRYEYAFCSAPAFTGLVPAHVKEFLMYHHVLFEGKIHFFYYWSAPIEPEVMAVLQPLVDAGLVTLVDFSREVNYHIMYHGQAPAINDCLYRTKFTARWSLFWDMDEYLFMPPPSTSTIQSLLEEHKDAPWISFGKIDFRFTHCNAPQPKEAGEEGASWAVERMVYRLDRYFCMDKCNAEKCKEMCPSEKGMRKWIANPRKVKSAVTHSISDPKDLRDGVVLNAKVARFNHYRGLVAPRARENCGEVRDPATDLSITDSDGKTTLVMDDELAKFVASSSMKSKAESLKIFGGTQ